MKDKPRQRLIGGDYKSKTTLFGLPLIHVVYGPSYEPTTGKIRTAKGIIAVGGLSVGVIAFGGVSFGLIAFGGVAFGLLAALGGLAVGTGISIGGGAISFAAFGGGALGYYAVGGGAIGIHAIDHNTPLEQVPQWLRWLRPR